MDGEPVSDSDNEERGEKEKTPPPGEEVSEPPPTGFVCTTCGVRFARKFNRDRHVRLTHNNIARVYDCSFCGATFDNSKKLQEHRVNHTPSTGFEVKQSAFRKKCVIYRKNYSEKMLTLENAFNVDKKEMQELIEYEVGVRRSMKLGIIYHAEFSRLQPQMGGAAGDVLTPPPNENNEEIAEGEGEIEREEEGEENEEAAAEAMDNEQEIDISEADNVPEEMYEICLRAPSVIVTAATNVKHVLHNARQQIQNRIDDFIENGSGWRLNAILFADLEIGNCAALNGSCNQVSIKYLKKLKSTRASKKMQKCFFHACAFHFLKSENITKLELWIKKCFVIKVASPVNVKDIAKFERDNAHLKMGINVIHMEGKNLYPLIFSKSNNAEHKITLLLYKTKVDDKVVSHYTYVSDVNKLLRKRYFNGLTYTYGKTISCLNCFSKFYSKGKGPENLENHYEHCSKNKPQAVRVPTKGASIKFKNHVNKFESYFCGFFDFESRHKKEKYQCAKCKNDAQCQHQTKVMAVQEPITCSYLILDIDEKIVFKNTFTGYDCTQRFLQELLDIEPELQATLSRNMDLNMSVEDEQEFQATTQCHICDKYIWENDPMDFKVRDHCHISGDFLGAAHASCNLKRVVKKQIPMYCHNLTGYDGHFLMQHLGDKMDGITKLKALPLNSEKFRCITVNSYEFKDSLSFLNASLNELMNNLLQNKNHTFPIMDQMGIYEKHEKNKKKLILRKGIYPYEYASSIEKLRKTRCIPKKKYFFSTLTNSGVSDEDYQHSKKVFKKYKCENLICYTELYCKSDVAILAEIVTQFRKTIMENFNLDCCHYISTPQLAFDCMLRLTGVEIELLTDIDQIIFIEQNIRGGVSYINQRHCVEKTTDDHKTEMKFIDGEYNYYYSQRNKMSHLVYIFSK
jgi:hypothetical protein